MRNKDGINRYICRKEAAALAAAVLLLSAAAAGGTAAEPNRSVSDSAPSVSDFFNHYSGKSDKPSPGMFGGFYITSADSKLKSSDSYKDWNESDELTFITADGKEPVIEGSGAKTDGEGLLIESGGIYVLSGTLEGQIRVEAGKEEDVRLVFNGLEVTCPDGPAVNVVSADRVMISLAYDSFNKVADSEGRSTKEKQDQDAAIYSREDLIFNGYGVLEIEGNYEDGVHGKDDVRIMEGDYSVRSVDDGIVAKDRLEIEDGSFFVESGGDALKCTNSEDEGRGFVHIVSGNYVINSGGEGIQAATALWIRGGDCTVRAKDKGFKAGETIKIDSGNIMVAESNEGMDAPEIVINAGDLAVYSSEDGINASGGEADGKSGGYIFITGGNTYVNSGGDGLDSNTSIYQSGGTVVVEGPLSDKDGALDYDEEYRMSGGNLLAIGSSGMMQAISPSSDTCCLGVISKEVLPAGTKIAIFSRKGKKLREFESTKIFTSLVFAGSDIETGESYVVFLGKKLDVEISMTESVTITDLEGNRIISQK